MSQTLPIEIHRRVVYKKQSAIELLSNTTDLSRQQLLQCFDSGAVWLEPDSKPRRLREAETILKPGQKIHLYCNQTTLTPCPFIPRLVQDFCHFSVWNKPSGMLSQGSKWGEHWALYHWIRQHHWPERESFITHRLDRYTSGLMIVAHDDRTNKKFHRLFETRKIQKTYRAIVSGLMTPGDNITVDTPVDHKNAETLIRVLQQQVSSQQSLVEIKPTSGRKHQIRIHLASVGHPVINDRQYGQPPFAGDLKLQASELQFKHPLDYRERHIILQRDELLSLAAS